MNIKYLFDWYGHKTDTIYIVGKGQSLEFVTPEIFGKGVVITINESIVSIEKLGLSNLIISMQKDGAYPHRNKCQCKNKSETLCKFGMIFPSNKSTVLLVSETDSFDCFTDYEPRFYFNNQDYGLSWEEPSVLSAISIAKSSGAKIIIMVAFDSFTYGDLTTYIPTTGERIPEHPYFVQHERMKNLLSDIEHEFLTPKA